MSDALLIATARFLRDLLALDEQVIRIGRQGYERTDFEGDYVVIDALDPARRITSSERFDGTAESIEYSDTWQQQLILDFYGTQAYDRAMTFCALCRSQVAYELRVALGLNVHRPSTVTNVSALTGQQYGIRYQVRIQVTKAVPVSVDTLRIDTAQTEIRDETGVKYSG